VMPGPYLPQCYHQHVLTMEAMDGPSHLYVQDGGDYDVQAHRQFSHQSRHLPCHHLLKERRCVTISIFLVINTKYDHKTCYQKLSNEDITICKLLILHKPMNMYGHARATKRSEWCSTHLRIDQYTNEGLGSHDYTRTVI
jgi:hypothetical protein